MAAISAASSQRFDRNHRLRPVVLALVIACHILLAILVLRFFTVDLEQEMPAPPVFILEDIALAPPLVEEPTPSVDIAFEQTADPGLSGSNNQARSQRALRRDLPERRRPPLPDPAMRLTNLEVASGGAAPVLDTDRLGSLAGSVEGLGNGTGRGSGSGNGNGQGVEGDSSGGGDTTRNVTWSPRFDRRTIQRFMPREARRQRIYGLVVLECTALRNDRVADCAVIEEHPQGYGFGEAALDAEDRLLLQVTDASGNRIYGERIRPYIEFRVQ